MHECNETRCYGWQDKREMQNMWKTIHARGSRQIEKLSAAIEQKPTWMDRTAIEHLSSRQKVSWWIENLSSCYREKVQKAQWIEIALTSIETRRKRGSIDSNLSRGVEKLSTCAKIVFQRTEKHEHECNQACYSTNDLINMLSSQKYLSTRKM